MIIISLNVPYFSFFNLNLLSVSNVPPGTVVLYDNKKDCRFAVICKYITLKNSYRQSLYPEFDLARQTAAVKLFAVWVSDFAFALAIV